MDGTAIGRLIDLVVRRHEEAIHRLEVSKAKWEYLYSLADASLMDHCGSLFLRPAKERAEEMQEILNLIEKPFL